MRAGQISVTADTNSRIWSGLWNVTTSRSGVIGLTMFRTLGDHPSKLRLMLSRACPANMQAALCFLGWQKQTSSVDGCDTHDRSRRSSPFSARRSAQICCRCKVSSRRTISDSNRDGWSRHSAESADRDDTSPLSKYPTQLHFLTLCICADDS